jgi:hypothetical protein
MKRQISMKSIGHSPPKPGAGGGAIGFNLPVKSAAPDLL